MLAYANDHFRDYTLIPFSPPYLPAQKYLHPHRSWHQHTRRLAGKDDRAAGLLQSSLLDSGILQHEYAIKPEDMQWIISTKSSDKGKVSKNESALPEGVPIQFGPEGVDESEMLVAGKVDAVFSAKEPQAYIDGHPKIARLFSDYRQVEGAYFTKTGIFPSCMPWRSVRTSCKTHIVVARGRVPCLLSGKAADV